MNGITAFLHVSRLKFIIGYLGKSINFFTPSAPKYLFSPSLPPLALVSLHPASTFFFFAATHSWVIPSNPFVAANYFTYLWASSCHIFSIHHQHSFSIPSYGAPFSCARLLLRITNKWSPNSVICYKIKRVASGSGWVSWSFVDKRSFWWMCCNDKVIELEYYTELINRTGREPVNGKRDLQ